MHFQLFIPTENFNRPLADVLQSVGCEHLIERATAEPLRTGPNETPGVLVSWMVQTGHVHKIKRPDWIPAKPLDDLKSERYFIGFDPLDLPKPYELERNHLYVGEALEMGDHQHWVVPCECDLPKQIVLSEDGRPEFESLQKFDEFCLLAAQWRNALAIAQLGSDFVEKELAQFVEMALRINYRTLPELTFDVLKLYTSGSLGTIHPALKATILITNNPSRMKSIQE